VAACRDRVTDFLRSITADITELLIKPDTAHRDHVFPFVLPQACGSSQWRHRARRRTDRHARLEDRLGDRRSLVSVDGDWSNVDLGAFLNGKEWAHLGTDKTEGLAIRNPSPTCGRVAHETTGEEFVDEPVAWADW